MIFFQQLLLFCSVRFYLYIFPLLLYFFYHVQRDNLKRVKYRPIPHTIIISFLNLNNSVHLASSVHFYSMLNIQASLVLAVVRIMIHHHILYMWMWVLNLIEELLIIHYKKKYHKSQLVYIIFKNFINPITYYYA